MPSVSRRAAGQVLGACGLALALCGCATTQTTAARLRLNDDRIRASELPTRVTPGQVSSSVVVSAQTLLSARGHFTAVVRLSNPAGAAVSDLPVSIGYRRGARTVYLNAAAANYFDNHLPAIAAHGTLSWVTTGSGQIPKQARTFVRIGATPTVRPGRFTPPVIAVSRVTTAGAGTAGGSVLAAQVTNRSSIPQYQLPVYAVITDHGQVVGGSNRSIADLAGGATAVVRLALPAGAGGENLSVRVEAPATIFK